MLLHFDRTLVEQLLNHAETTPGRRAYHQQGGIEPALWLIGDDGIYLMSDGDPILPAEAGSMRSLVCYAAECDPHRQSFDDWWAVKNTAFGGDDGVEFFTAETIRTALATYKPDEALIFDVTPDAIGLVAYRTVITPKPAPQPARHRRKRSA